MSTENETSRRLFLAAGSASAVFGALVQAAAASAPGDDPIYAAIERHRAAETRFYAACELADEELARQEGRTIGAGDRAEREAASEEFLQARHEFLTTAPATVAGVRAFVRHCIDMEHVEEFLPDALETLLDSPVLVVKH